MSDPFTKDTFADTWDSFCEADPVFELDTFLNSAEEMGLIEWVPVDDDAVSESFAEERGIIPGGMMWQLTSAGEERWKKCRARP